MSEQLTKSQIRAMVAEWPFQKPVKARVEEPKKKQQVRAEVEPQLSRRDRVLQQTLADFLAGEK
jgi:hypothetical protein